MNIFGQRNSADSPNLDSGSLEAQIHYIQWQKREQRRNAHLQLIEKLIKRVEASSSFNDKQAPHIIRELESRGFRILDKAAFEKKPQYELVEALQALCAEIQAHSDSVISISSENFSD